MRTLLEIKDEVAVKYGYYSWNDWEIRGVLVTNPYPLYFGWEEVCKIAQREAVIASLAKAAENVRANWNGFDKDSIIDERNIVIIE